MQDSVSSQNCIFCRKPQTKHVKLNVCSDAITSQLKSVQPLNDISCVESRPARDFKSSWINSFILFQRAFKATTNGRSCGVALFIWHFGFARQGEDPRRHKKAAAEKVVTSFVTAEWVCALRETTRSSSSSSSSEGEDGAALRPCHVSVWRNTNTSQKDGNICGLVVLVPPFSVRGGRTVHGFGPDRVVNSGKCGVCFDQLHSCYGRGVLRFVVRTLCRLFSDVQSPGQRH